MLIFLFSAVVIPVAEVFAVDRNYCRENVPKSETSEMKFSKELSNQEFGIGNHPKSIHCCAENFDSIEWFKNNESYPWTNNVSNFQIDSGSKNQTLYAEKITSTDAGVYTCRITSRHSFRSREIPLHVFESEFSKVPKVTFTPPTRVTVNLRDAVRLYCETFVGKIDLPDAQYNIRWYKKNFNSTVNYGENNNSRISVKKITRDNGLTLGMYLYIDSVEKNDFGSYVCSVSNTGDQIIELASEITYNDHVPVYYLWLAIGLLVVVITLTVFFYKYNYHILLFIRPFVTRVKCEENSDANDVFVLFEIREGDFVNQILMPRLSHFRYSVDAHILENGVFVGTECQTRITNSRTVLVVLSSPEPQNLQDCKYFSQKLYTASKLCDKVRVICLIIQQRASINDAEIRKMVESNNHLTYFAWPLYKKDWSRLWLSLRYNLGLPVRKNDESFDTVNIGRYPTVNHVACSV